MLREKRDLRFGKEEGMAISSNNIHECNYKFYLFLTNEDSSPNPSLLWSLQKAHIISLSNFPTEQEAEPSI